jgi:hypothetical protein
LGHWDILHKYRDVLESLGNPVNVAQKYIFLINNISIIVASYKSFGVKEIVFKHSTIYEKKGTTYDIKVEIVVNVLHYEIYK